MWFKSRDDVIETFCKNLFSLRPIKLVRFHNLIYSWQTHLSPIVIFYHFHVFKNTQKQTVQWFSKPWESFYFENHHLWPIFWTTDAQNPRYNRSRTTSGSWESWYFVDYTIHVRLELIYLFQMIIIYSRSFTIEEKS